MTPLIIQKIIEAFISKKRVIGWIAAVIFAAGSVAVGMKSSEFKEAVCGAPAIQEVGPAAPAK